MPDGLFRTRNCARARAGAPLTTCFPASLDAYSQLFEETLNED